MLLQSGPGCLTDCNQGKELLRDSGTEKLPRRQQHAQIRTMWTFLRCTLCLFVSSQLGFGSVWTASDELDREVKVEVLFKPEECTKKSKKGDLINAHYDGYLAKDGSQFYCRLVAFGSNSCSTGSGCMRVNMRDARVRTVRKKTKLKIILHVRT